MKQVYANVASMPTNGAAQATLDKYGLHAYAVTWEDTARTKNSSLGPNISDMTLRADGMDMPVIRRPNFSDLTFDVPVDRIKLHVGNEHGETKHRVSLEEYLANLRHYLHMPLAYDGKSLFVPERDAHVLMSAQACMLPVPMGDGEKSKFLVALRNYQSRANAPAVLVLVSTDDGTSAHVMNTSGTELLYFNKNGQRCPLLAERLGAYRRSQGRPDDDSPMNEEERAKNLIMIVQVPLKQSLPKQTWGELTKMQATTLGFGGTPANSPSGVPPSGLDSWFGGGDSSEEAPESDDMGFDLFDEAASKPTEARFDFWDEAVPVPVKTKVERAIVSVGEPEGPFNELCGQKAIERDPQYPIRVTLQYYYATTTGSLDATLARQIDEQMRDAQKYYQAVAAGSLVLNPDSKRTTEIKEAVPVPPAWWPTFAQLYWDQLKDLYPSQDAAAQFLFKNGRFTQDGMSTVEKKALELLRSNGKKVV